MLIKLPNTRRFSLRLLLFCFMLLGGLLTAPPAAFSASGHADGSPADAGNSFSWHVDRPLTWEDFQGAVRTGAPDRFAAETNCGIGIETNRVSAFEKVRVKVSNRFYRNLSWVRPGSARSEVLRHEQCHWDICEIYTRIMQARFDAADISGANLRADVQRIYDEVSQAYVKRQEQYERETQHGTIPAEQARWEAQIAQELAATSSSQSLD